MAEVSSTEVAEVAVEVADLDSRSECTGRNGTYGVGMVLVQVKMDGMASIGAVSKNLHRVLNGGISISADDMDRLALEWIRYRGVEHNAVQASDVVEAMRLLKEAEERLSSVVSTKEDEE